ncbi:hypothetical protein GGR52DRAFT_77944 [Hypoxylon sp. FL1284]|nr:hypothetical protein GGR52DRAFT_77944 [Hypoxylon sp. FL1284]
MIGGLELGFHHVRLAMNSNLFGPGHGLSLKRFKTTVKSASSPWRSKYTARIIGDQFFLHAEHRIHVYGYPPDNYNALDYDFKHYICYHTTTHSPGLPGATGPPAIRRFVRPIKILHLFPSGCSIMYDADRNEKFHHAFGSCPVCLTDYNITVQEEKFGSGKQLLHITIISYHQLGFGRSPSDWAWRTSSTPCERYIPYLPTRSMSRSMKTEVQGQWERDSSRRAANSILPMKGRLSRAL